MQCYISSTKFLFHFFDKCHNFLGIASISWPTKHRKRNWQLTINNSAESKRHESLNDRETQSRVKLTIERERKKKITDWKDTRIDLAVPSKGDLATVSSSDYLLMALPFVLLDFFLTYFLNIIAILVLWFLFDARDRMENRVNISISPSDLGIVSRNWVGIWNAGGCSVARSADFPPPHGDCGCGRQRLQLGTSPVARKRFLPVTAGCCLAAT